MTADIGNKYLGDLTFYVFKHRHRLQCVLFDMLSNPYLKCPQRRLYSAWKIADIYLRRFAEYWNAMSASLRRLEFFSVHTSTVFPYACLQMSAERSTDVCRPLCGRMDGCGRLCGCPHRWVRTSADVHMDGCGCLGKSTWMGADVRRAKGSVSVAPPAV